MTRKPKPFTLRCGWISSQLLWRRFIGIMSHQAIIVIALFSLLSFLGCAQQTRTTAKKCEPLLYEADLKYKIGEPDRSLQLITKYVNCCKQSKNQPSLYILELLPLIYIAKDDGEKAKYWVGILLYQLPDFNPTRSYPPEFYKYLDEVRKQRARGSRTTKKSK